MFKIQSIIVLYILESLLLFGVPTKPNSKSNSRSRACGYEACPKVDSNVLNVHIIPHSHQDVGWLKTVDQYYWGSKPLIQKAAVQYIIDSVVVALLQNPERRFVQVETAFLYKWWSKATDYSKIQFLKLVENGQIEIVGGGWSMNDEATSNYQSIIDQLTLGLRFINETFGICGLPKIGWQVDVFGNSREMASILSQMGYDALFVGRLDYRDKLARFDTKTIEMMWQGSASLGDKSKIFTSVLFNGYRSPWGFCFDVLCADEPIVNDLNNSEYNYDHMVNDFASYIKAQAAYYTTNNILIPMGGDFCFQDALSHFTNLDVLIKGFKIFNHTHGKNPIRVLYSTPSCYIKAVNEEAALKNVTFPVKFDDFFPYASDAHAYWTGFYTSRPTSKRFVREGNNLLQIVKQLSTFIKQEKDDVAGLRLLQEIIAVMQHHDAISGTEKQHVANDYHRRLTEAIRGSIRTVGQILSSLLSLTPMDSIILEIVTCLYANVSICKVSQSDDFLIAVYNPLSRYVSSYVRLPVNTDYLAVFGPDNSPLPYDICPAVDKFLYLMQHHPAPFDLVFLAKDLPPLGLKIYKVRRSGQSNRKCLQRDNSTKKFRIGNDTNGFEIDADTGLLKTASLNGQTISVKQEIMYYIASKGNNSNTCSRAAGAYIFRPSPEYPEAVHLLGSVQTTTYRGSLVEEVHQMFNAWITQVIRSYKQEKYIEVDWLIGPISISDHEGKEVISRFSTELNTDDIFYTDSNCREMLKRKRNYRPTYQFTGDERVTGNYYPITSRIVLKDVNKNLEFAVLTDRSQGGSSLASGQVELMIHRRLLHDDAFGVDEALNEKQYKQGVVVRGRHYVLFGRHTSNIDNSFAVVQKDVVQQKLFEPLSFLVPHTTFWNVIHKEISGLRKPLPPNVQILTLEPWKSSENTILLRLEHVYEREEDQKFSKPAAINLNQLFTYFEVISAKEMNLAVNKELMHAHRLKWTTTGSLEKAKNMPPSRNINDTKREVKTSDLEFYLWPMEIRTFILTVKYK